jgi:hypothetical protein
MARVIDADALQELCDRRIQDTWNSGTAPVSWAHAYADFKDDIDSMPTMPTLTPPNGWVSIEERLPEESDGMVLLTNGKVVTSGYRNHMFRLDGEEGIYTPAIRKGGGYLRVTYWMPLPTPPDCRPPEGEEET